VDTGSEQMTTTWLENKEKVPEKYISCKGKQDSYVPLKASGRNIISSELPDKGK